jgi:CheY-like chemotaxis protein
MKRSILIVDDEFGLADLMAELLREQGFRVTVAINGRNALDSFVEQAPDLLITDLMMPIMDGLELVQRIRETPAYASIPVIFMTAAPQALVEHGKKEPTSVLVKPFSPAKLFELVQSKLS